MCFYYCSVFTFQSSSVNSEKKIAISWTKPANGKFLFCFSSELNAFYAVTFDLPGLYLYQCTPHGHMGMLGLVVVGNDFHNLKNIRDIELSRVAQSVLERLIRIAQSN